MMQRTQLLLEPEQHRALAQELGAELWTGDRRLAHGAQQAGAGWVHGV